MHLKCATLSDSITHHPFMARQKPEAAIDAAGQRDLQRLRDVDAATGRLGSMVHTPTELARDVSGFEP